MENESLLAQIDALKLDILDHKKAYDHMMEEYRRKEMESYAEPPEVAQLRQLQAEFVALEKLSTERFRQKEEDGKRLESDFETCKKELSVCMSDLDKYKKKANASIEPSTHQAVLLQLSQSKQNAFSLSETIKAKVNNPLTL